MLSFEFLVNVVSLKISFWSNDQSFVVFYKILIRSLTQTLKDRNRRRIAGVSPAFQDRGRLACMRLYSTANERG
jgi:hypothetical protein